MCNEMYTVDGDQCMRDITSSQWRQRSDGTAGGVFEEGLSAANGGYYYDANGLQTGWVEEEHGVNTRIYDLLKIPDEAITAAFKIDHEFDNDMAGYFQLQYSQNNSLNTKSPEDEYENAYVLIFDPLTGEPGRVRPGYISVDNPFVPQEIRDNASGSINWDRRFYEVGNILTDNERTTVRSWAGLQGTTFDGTWDWDLSVGYGKFTQKQTRHNELNTVRVAQALDAEYAADGVTIQCADADARAAGCVPLNIFGEGSITPEMADWIRATPSIETNVTQVNILGYIAGDLFEMPAGSVSSVFGFEYRRDKQDLETSEGHRMGGITFNVVPSFVGDLDVTEVFGEVNMPLLRNVTGARNLSADFSYRLADYGHDNSSNVGSYKFGLLWEPVEGYSFRANWANAQRAPSITELESPPRGDFDSFDDICADVTATSTGAGHEACRQDPGIAAAIAANGVFEDENNGYSPNAGNPNLIEETAETFTFGIAMEPIEDLRIAIDYFDISIEDAMEQIPNEEILAQCYASETQAYGANNLYCGFVTRNSEGQIIEILQVTDNIAETSTKGYDIALEYKIDLGEYGRLKLKADSTHVDEYVETFFGNDGQVVTEYQGQLWSGIFDDVATASLTWYKDNWRVRWSTRYMSSIVDDNERVEEWEEALADNNAACAAGDASCVTNPETPMALYFSAYLKHNLSVSYNMEFEDDSELRLYAGVRNVFNDVGPFIPYYGIVSETARGNASSEYDSGVGRYVYMGAEYQF
ncbi:MAG: TonB-dependent receptor, partial [Kangiellaceae bacterium]|nr:TonB-dependent receptor [Kangiellaceae bacterium]